MLIPTHLPHINTDVLHLSEPIQEGVFAVLGVGNLRVHPFALVVGVVYLLWLPLTLSRQQRQANKEEVSEVGLLS